MPDARIRRHTKIEFQPFAAHHLAFLAPAVELPDGSEINESYCHAIEKAGDAVTMLIEGAPGACVGIINRGGGIGEVWALVSPAARLFPLALTRGVIQRILPAKEHMRLSLIFAYVRRQEPKWNWWIGSIRVAMPDGTKKRFEIRDTVTQYAREYILWVMNFR